MRAAVIALAALALTGCGLFSSPSGPKPAPLPPLEQAQNVRVLWTAQVGGAARFVFAPARVEDAVYTAARDGTVVRLDAATGAERWRVSTESRLSAGVGSDGRVAAVATEDGEVIALDAASGALRWRGR